MDPKVKDEIEDMCNHADRVGLQRTWKNIQDVLSTHNLVSTLVIPCDQIGVHPRNRDGFGVARCLLSLVAEVRYDEGEVDAWSIEVCHLQQGMVTKFNEDLVRAGTASHTSQDVEHVPHVDGEKVLTCDGVLDM